MKSPAASEPQSGKRAYLLLLLVRDFAVLRMSVENALPSTTISFFPIAGSKAQACASRMITFN
jgi:hypothetical protein